METIISTIPGYRVYEYLLVLSPHQELWQRILKVKNEFYETYKATTAKWGKPHVTIVNFVQYEMMEERIINRLKIIGMSYPPFKVELKDFGSFPSHTIYINIVSKVAVMNAVKTLRQNAQTFMKIDKDNKPYFITEPHLTIARKLQPWQYEKGWLEYEHAHFHGRFIADHALLLRRRAEEYYKQVEKFVFEGVKEKVKQTELFNL